MLLEEPLVEGPSQSSFPLGYEKYTMSPWANPTSETVLLREEIISSL